MHRKFENIERARSDNFKGRISESHKPSVLQREDKHEAAWMKKAPRKTRIAHNGGLAAKIGETSNAQLSIPWLDKSSNGQEAA
jgi:hypothetical protein